MPFCAFNLQLIPSIWASLLPYRKSRRYFTSTQRCAYFRCWCLPTTQTIVAFEGFSSAPPTTSMDRRCLANFINQTRENLRRRRRFGEIEKAKSLRRFRPISADFDSRRNRFPILKIHSTKFR